MIIVIHRILCTYIHIGRDSQRCLLARKGSESFFSNTLSSLEWGEQKIFEECLKTLLLGLPLVVQWLELCVPCAGGLVLVPGQGTRSHMP